MFVKERTLVHRVENRDHKVNKLLLISGMLRLLAMSTHIGLTRCIRGLKITGIQAR